MWQDSSITTDLQMFLKEVFRNILFDDRRKYWLSGGNYYKEKLKMPTLFWPVENFTPASLHPWPSRNEWPPHVLGIALWFRKQHINGLIAQCHDIISCKSESAWSPPFFFLSHWSKGLSNGLRFKTSRLACGSHRVSPPAPSFILQLGVWALSGLLRLL